MSRIAPLRPHGPFTCSQIYSLAQSLSELPGLSSLSSVQVLGHEDPAVPAALCMGLPCICLVPPPPGESVGHFVALVPRGADLADIECFDPASCGLPLVSGALGGVLRRARDLIDGSGRRFRLSYCPWGAQPPDTDCCGLVCILRCLRRSSPPHSFIDWCG